MSPCLRSASSWSVTPSCHQVLQRAAARGDAPAPAASARNSASMTPQLPSARLSSATAGADVVGEPLPVSHVRHQAAREAAPENRRADPQRQRVRIPVAQARGLAEQHG